MRKSPSCTAIVCPTNAGKIVEARLHAGALDAHPEARAVGHVLAGLDVADLCVALREGRTPRANCAQTFHVLDLMCAFHDSASEGREYVLKPGYVRQPQLGLEERF